MLNALIASQVYFQKKQLQQAQASLTMLSGQIIVQAQVSAAAYCNVSQAAWTLCFWQLPAQQQDRLSGVATALQASGVR